MLNLTHQARTINSLIGKKFVKTNKMVDFLFHKYVKEGSNSEKLTSTN